MMLDKLDTKIDFLISAINIVMIVAIPISRLSSTSVPRFHMKGKEIQIKIRRSKKICQKEKTEEN